MTFTKFFALASLTIATALPPLQAFAQTDPKTLLAVREDRVKRQLELITNERAHLATLSSHLEDALSKQKIGLAVGIPIALIGTAVTVWSARWYLASMGDHAGLGRYFRLWFGTGALAGLSITGPAGYFMYISHQKAKELKDAVHLATEALEKMQQKLETDKAALEEIRLR